MSIPVELKDYGTTLEFPDGTSPEDIKRYVDSKYPPKKTKKPSPNISPEWGGKHPTLYGVAGATREAVGPIAEALGWAGGEIYGAIQAGPIGAPLGGGVGYATIRQGTLAADQALGNIPQMTPSQQFGQYGEDVVAGATGSMMAPVVTKAAGAVLKPIGKGLKQLFGITTGAGPEMVEEAVKAGERTGWKPLEQIATKRKNDDFIRAMKGEISGQEIVDNTRAALESIKAQRGREYRSALESISKNRHPIDTSDIANVLDNELNNWRVSRYVDEKGREIFDFSQSKLATDPKAQGVVRKLVNTFSKWNDKTPIGIDTFKQAVDNTYSENSLVRSFTAKLRDVSKKTVSNAVPQYAKMEKNYSDITKIIQDIESSFILKKQGLSGRNTADNVLRRLTSAMRENFEMRKALLDTLGSKGGVNLSEQVAGYTASSWMPKGLVGKIAAGSEIFFLANLSPEYWPLIASTSPRVMGGFLHAWGKTLVQAKQMSPAAYKTFSYKLSKYINESDNKQVK